MIAVPSRPALVIVDVQNDFTEDGSLPVTGGAQCAADITAWLEANPDYYALVIASRDWHEDGHDNGGHFADGTEPDYAGTWPVHCVDGTDGAAYHPGLDTSRIDVHVRKGQGSAAYSAFEGTSEDGRSMTGILDEAAITSVDIVGIATDYCVKATALDALEVVASVRLLADLCAGVGEQTTEAAVRELAQAGVVVTTTTDVRAAHAMRTPARSGHGQGFTA